MSVNIHVYLHGEPPQSVTEALDEILTQLVCHRRETRMASAELKAVLARVDVATDNIAADIRRLKEKVGTGMSEAEVADVQAAAEAVANKLDGIAADPDNPDPTA